MVQIDFSSAKMTVDHSGAVPAVSVGPRFASVHLTQGFISTEVEPKRNREAFTITGEVDVVATGTTELITRTVSGDIEIRAATLASVPLT